MKKILKKEVIIAFIVGIILASSIAVYAYSYAAKDVSYTKPGTTTATSVEAALNELYNKMIDINQTNATSADLLSGKKAYTKNGLIEGTYEEPAFILYVNAFRGEGTGSAGVSFKTANYNNYTHYKISQTNSGTSTSVAIKRYDWGSNNNITLNFNTEYSIVNDNGEIFFTPNSGWREIKVEFFKK